MAFITPTLPLSTRTLASSRTPRINAAPVKMSLRFPNGPRNPFNLRPGNNFGGFSGFGAFGGSDGSDKAGGPFGNNGGRKGRGSGGTGGGTAGDGNVFSSIWAAYCSTLDKNPITTKAFTSLVGFFLGDLLAQKFLGDKNAPLDTWRLARMASFGFLIHGPTGHFFYAALDRAIVGTAPLKVASKVAIDQLCWAPIFTALFFGYLGVAEKKSFEDVKNKVKNDTWSGVQASWKFWPIAHAINFAFIPTSQRLLYINTLQVGYNVILSLLGNK